MTNRELFSARYSKKISSKPDDLYSPLLKKCKTSPLTFAVRYLTINFAETMSDSSKFTIIILKFDAFNKDFNFTGAKNQNRTLHIRLTPAPHNETLTVAFPQVQS